MEGFYAMGEQKVPIAAHHTPPSAIPEDIPKIAVLRETVDWCYAFYWDYAPQETFEDWFKKPLPNMSWVGGDRLDCYFEYVDYYFLYEDGLDNMFRALYGKAPKMIRIGHHKELKENYVRTEEEAEMIRERLAWDVELYNEVKNGFRRWKP